MNNHDIDLTLEKHAEEYKHDPEFIAEGLSIKVVEELLEGLERKGLNQSWLAQSMGVSRAHVSRILNAPPNMTLLTIAKMAVALGATPDVSLNAGPRRACYAIPHSAADFVIQQPAGNICVEVKHNSVSEGTPSLRLVYYVPTEAEHTWIVPENTPSTAGCPTLLSQQPAIA